VNGEDDRNGPLAVLTIIDLSEGIAGSYAASLFSNYGSRVIKVERPDAGASAHRMGPYLGDKDPEHGVPFFALNGGKLSLTLDYETPEGAELFIRLCEEADGVIEDTPVRRRADLGLDADTLIAHVARLVITAVDAAAFTNPAEQHLIGLHAFLGALGGLWHAAQREHGQVVDVRGESVLASLAASGLVAVSSAAPELDALRVANLVREVEHPTAGVLTYAAAPIILSETPTTYGHAPLLGEHTDHVLHDLLRLEASEIESLRAKGVV
jgi:crotonobetainyl-CoA:carnitine CoA-transferase CaiB-like acyl-CoA transferase